MTSLPSDSSANSFGFHSGDLRSSLERIETALTQSGQRFKKTGDHLQAVCPVHDDTAPSLSIDWKRDGLVVLDCKAGCSSEDVIAALGMSWPELHDNYEPPEVYAARRREERARGINRPRPKRERPATPSIVKGRLPKKVVVDEIRPLGDWQLVTAYPYVDVDGQVVQEEVRHERQIEVVKADGTTLTKTEKRFTQRWPDTRGGWRTKTPEGFEPVLYGFPDVVDWVAAGRVIWLCEGVKDVLRFLELGEAATTNPSGATNFKASQAQVLAGAHVVVVVDHDAAGYGRAVRLHQLLADRVAGLRFALPRTTERHSDASDHFNAGYGLNFAEASIEQLVALEQTSTTEDVATRARAALQEVHARLRRASTAGDNAKKSVDETKAAQRWADEVGQAFLKVAEITPAADVDESTLQRLETAIDQVRSCVYEAYDAVGIDLPAPVALALEQLLEPAVDQGEDESVAEEPRAAVLEGPGSQKRPEPTARIPTSRGTWAYELGGEGRRPRGVYVLNDSRWVQVAALPYVKARIIERDGSGRRTGMQWLASATEDGPGLIISWDDLGSGRWSNMLDLWVSRDKRVEENTATAFELIAQQAEERERTPRVEDGRISVPVPDTLPGGYLVTGDLERDAAIERWREILKTAAASPRLALVLGAAAIGPYVGALRRQSHIVALYGDSDNGKSVTMSVAGAIWGDTLSDGSAVVRPWNSTGNGVIRFLGQLGILPGFFDEAGQANATTPREWGKLIYDICEGAQRMGAEMRGLGVRVTMPWHGVLISAGNGRLTDGLGAGRYAGVAKRVIDVETPLTISAEHAEKLKALLPGAVGHLGHEILERHTAESVAPLIDEAEKVLGMPEGGNERTVAKHLHAHLAGAMILDQITGAEGALYYAALQAAAEYLEQWAPPEHDGDRLVEAIRDAIGREPAMWPEMSDYLEHKQTPTLGDDGFGRRLPMHGVNKSLSGLLRTDHETGEQTVWVFNHEWKSLCEDLGADSAVACRELHKRDVLRRPDSSRRANLWVTKVRATGARMYELHFDPRRDPEMRDSGAENGPPPRNRAPETGRTGNDSSSWHLPTGNDSAETGAVPPERSTRSTSVPRDVPPDNVPLTCDVPRVPPENGEGIHVRAHVDTAAAGRPSTSPPCVVCGHPASQLIDGRALHLGECALVLEQAGDLEEASAGELLEQPLLEEPLLEEPPAASGGHTALTPASSATKVARFSAPAVVLDDEHIHLAGGSTKPWPGVAHLGDLALLTSRDQLRLGWGGGEDRLPDPGQVWLYPGALERLGLPATMDLPDTGEAMTRSQRSKATRKMFAKLDTHPMVAGAMEAGWEFGQGGHLGIWTRMWHRELLPGGAVLVGYPWHRIEGVALFDGDPTPAQLVDRLALFARHVGVTYRMTSAATGLDLIDHHRPPRRSVDDSIGAGRGRIALVRGLGAELPPWRKKVNDTRFNALRADFSWWRQWDQLSAEEQGQRYVHAWDRNASYLTPWQSIDLGVEDLQHRTGEAARWDGKEKPGYYLVDDWEWPFWGLPAPAGAKVSGGRVWVTVHTLKQLAMVGIEPAVHESFTWGVSTRYLEGPGRSLSQARTALQAAAGDDQDAAAVLRAVKMLYAATVGKLAERDHSEDYHLWRPDWQDHIISATKTQILRVVHQIQEATGASPLVVDRDAVFYASDDPDPATAWPGDPAKLGTKIGAWKPAYSAELTTWGPEFLSKRAGRWPYADAVAAMKMAGEA